MELVINQFEPWNNTNNDNYTNYFNVLDNDEKNIVIRIFCKYLVNVIKSRLKSKIISHPLLDFLEPQYTNFLKNNNLSNCTFKEVLLEIVENIELIKDNNRFIISINPTATFQLNPKVNIYLIAKKVEYGSEYLDALHLLTKMFDEIKNTLYLLWTEFLSKVI